MIAKGKYVRGGKANHVAAASRLNAHVKYIEHRRLDPLREQPEDRHIYNKESDHVNRKDAVRDVMEHTSQSVSYHSIILSPGEDEPVQNWHDWTRQVMQDLEQAQGKDLHWYAVNHSNTEHPHVHIVVAGAAEQRETGREEAVKLYAQDYQQLRESGHEHSEYEWNHRIADYAQTYEKQDTVTQEQDRVPISFDHDH